MASDTTVDGRSDIQRLMSDQCVVNIQASVTSRLTLLCGYRELCMGCISEHV